MGGYHGPVSTALPQEEQKRMLTDMVGKLAEVSQQQSKLEGMFFATTTTQTQMVTPSSGYMLGAVQNVAGRQLLLSYNILKAFPSFLLPD